MEKKDNKLKLLQGWFLKNWIFAILIFIFLLFVGLASFLDSYDKISKKVQSIVGPDSTEIIKKVEDPDIDQKNRKANPSLNTSLNDGTGNPKNDRTMDDRGRSNETDTTSAVPHETSPNQSICTLTIISPNHIISKIEYGEFSVIPLSGEMWRISIKFGLNKIRVFDEDQNVLLDKELVISSPKMRLEIMGINSFNLN